MSDEKEVSVSALTKSQVRHDLKSSIRNLKLIIDDWDDVNEEAKKKYRKDFELNLNKIKELFNNY